MPKIFNLLNSASLLHGTVAGFLFCLAAVAALPAQNGNGIANPNAASAPDEGAGYLNVCNATGLDGVLTILINGQSPYSEGYGNGSSTGQVGYNPGDVSVKVSHPRCESAKSWSIPLKKDDNLTMVVYAKERVNPKTGEVKTELELFQPPQRPSAGRLAVTVVNCAPEGVIPTVSFADEITVKGRSVMERLIPSRQDHHYIVLFQNKVTKQAQGLLALDFQVNTLQDEDARIRAEIEERVARERSANERHLMEYERRLAESKRARDQRMRERKAQESAP
jgi:hypothetical protein